MNPGSVSHAARAILGAAGTGLSSTSRYLVGTCTVQYVPQTAARGETEAPLLSAGHLGPKPCHGATLASPVQANLPAAGGDQARLARDDVVDECLLVAPPSLARMCAVFLLGIRFRRVMRRRRRLAGTEHAGATIQSCRNPRRVRPSRWAECQGMMSKVKFPPASHCLSGTPPCASRPCQ
ncbi:hypothetical protein DCS_07610 [Drechmeria coniospora]|uniref:Uncharacterized protein n=1 Tax=Drechmeria coniospora TaxID=98403 RepID=A0A151GEY5_DRECN|nr:hypothetical protein DCS_07610 [Drechmeria coniospora]KYK55646.1 hypothetical protein DCS_07610 [Drechmeria coniospora]